MSTPVRSSSVSSVRSRSRDIISTISANRASSRARSTDRAGKLSKTARSRTASPRRTGRLQSRRVPPFPRSGASSVDHIPSTIHAAANVQRTTGARRWDGNARTVTKWDAIRMDPELCLPAGDCVVHYYQRGDSRRGPSLRLVLADIQDSDCGPLLARHYTNAVLEPTQPAPELGDSAEYLPDAFPAVQHELYIPSPTGLTRDDAFHFHLTTRNFFAWMYEKPLVADRLGRAMIALFDRMNEYRPDPEQNQSDMLAYLEDQGYMDFRDCPDHALAVLQFAEKFHLQDLWTDAFVHCVGMNERLDSSAEFESVSRSSQALITRAHVEMQVRLERGGRSLSNFLEDELSGTFLGFNKELYSHLERFRSFLQSYYVGQHSYWPPAPISSDSSALPQSVYRSLYFDFRNLYQYLVDSRTALTFDDTYPTDGGISVLQKTLAFDRKHKYVSLPTPLPRLPKVFPSLASRRSFSRLNLLFAFNKQAKQDRRVAAAAALSAATNHTDPQVMECGLVQEYQHFEKTWTLREQGATFSCAEGRKVRWILVYAILQTLINVTKVPSEIRDTQGVAYPLCTQTAGTPPWNVGGLKAEKEKVNAKNMTLRERILADHDRRLQHITPSTPTPAPEAVADTAASSVLDLYTSTPSPIKPEPLSIPPRNTDTARPPHPVSTSFANRSSIKQPLPIRTKSWDVLALAGQCTPSVPDMLASKEDISKSSTPTTPNTTVSTVVSSTGTSDSISPSSASSTSASSISGPDGEAEGSDAMEHNSVTGTSDTDADAASSHYPSEVERPRNKKRQETRGRARTRLATKEPVMQAQQKKESVELPAVPAKSAKRFSFHAHAQSYDFDSQAVAESFRLRNASAENKEGGEEAVPPVPSWQDEQAQSERNRELEAYLAS